MGFEDIPPRIIFLTFLGWGITVLFIQGTVAIWGHAYRPAVSYLSLAAAFTLIFFRKRIIALAIVGFTFILVNTGLTALFHPTVVGLILTVGSGGGLFLIVRWHAKKYPNLARKDWKTIFDNRV